MTAPAKQSVEEAAREAAETYRQMVLGRPYNAFSASGIALGFEDGFMAGHRSRDAEVEAMRAKRLEELEGLAKEVCPGCAANPVAACYYSNVISACPSAPIHAAIARAKGE